eukprot:1196315-Prorocentrum_minimum.AAC.1
MPCYVEGGVTGTRERRPEGPQITNCQTSTDEGKTSSESRHIYQSREATGRNIQGTFREHSGNIQWLAASDA